MKKKVTPFRKGNIVRSGGNCVLVTGAGENDDYPQFAGVVIMAEKHDDEDKPWSVGMYSKTWSTGAFKKVNIKLSKAVYAALIGV